MGVGIGDQRELLETHFLDAAECFDLAFVELVVPHFDGQLVLVRWMHGRLHHIRTHVCVLRVWQVVECLVGYFQVLADLLEVTAFMIHLKLSLSEDLGHALVRLLGHQVALRL